MTNSLDQLLSGKLIGVKKLKIAAGLEEFPEEIISLADTLEILDLSDNCMSVLPDSISQLKKLKIIFFANNNFKVFPEILAYCPSLSMIGFKSNQIEVVPEDAFPPLLRWLILTDNNIKVLPKSIGKVDLLQKCALAGNQIDELPEEMANCTNLELLRISANQLKTIPDWLFRLPKLAWIAFSGNPGVNKILLQEDLEFFPWTDFEVGKLLGEGASGLIYKANWISRTKEVAIKVFKGDVTSDGLPEDEMGVAILAGYHENLVKVLGKVEGHPEGKNGLIMELIHPSFVNLGNPPNFDTCTRDVFNDETVFSEEEVLKITKSIASVCDLLHSKGINHGDLYAHNILVDSTGQSLLGDFGAASFYDVTSKVAHLIERIEVRAFGCLIEDLLERIDHDVVRARWEKIIAACLQSKVENRPSFKEIEELLAGF